MITCRNFWESMRRNVPNICDSDISWTVKSRTVIYRNICDSLSYPCYIFHMDEKQLLECFRIFREPIANFHWDCIFQDFGGKNCWKNIWIHSVLRLYLLFTMLRNLLFIFQNQRYLKICIYFRIYWRQKCRLHCVSQGIFSYFHVRKIPDSSGLDQAVQHACITCEACFQILFSGSRCSFSNLWKNVPFWIFESMHQLNGW